MRVVTPVVPTTNAHSVVFPLSLLFIAIHVKIIRMNVAGTKIADV